MIIILICHFIHARVLKNGTDFSRVDRQLVPVKNLFNGPHVSRRFVGLSQADPLSIVTVVKINAVDRHHDVNHKGFPVGGVDSLTQIRF